MPRTPAAVTREQILAVADELFYQRGVRAVGMDEVVRATGLGKMTIYRQFPTKDELVAAFLARRSLRLRGEVEAAIAAARTPRAKVLAIVRWIAAGLRQEDFRGCPFQNTSSEFPEADHPARPVIAAHEEYFRARWRELAAAAGARQPDRLARELVLLMNGAYATGHVLGAEEAGRHLLPMATRIVDAYMPAGRAAA